ncbi:indolepyruvate ferredoxin oxidoreductase subunit alpha [Lacrimispora aerotolerans]|uniref:indolepyruvate ferredoxin oxidoreductase subunit alpha n=1 Tax=Lacrimispora aerotolerans TaxID=36832 RepID=UPI0009FF3BC0
MSRRIDGEQCIGCGQCQRVCLVDCIYQETGRKRKVNETECVDCGACQMICPKKCIVSI